MPDGLLQIIRPQSVALCKSLKKLLERAHKHVFGHAVYAHCAHCYL